MGRGKSPAPGFGNELASAKQLRLLHRHRHAGHKLEQLPRDMLRAAEGYFSILKRGIMGTYHHVSQQHLKRYLAEFDFRYSNRAKLGIDDEHRAAALAVGIKGN
jgi:lysophospholipase L1-like esterase